MFFAAHHHHHHHHHHHLVSRSAAVAHQLLGPSCCAAAASPGVCLFAEAAKRHGIAPPVSIQNDFSPFLRGFESDLAEACAPSNYNIG
jgi:hypothetical protein